MLTADSTQFPRPRLSQIGFEASLYQLEGLTGCSIRRLHPPPGWKMPPEMLKPSDHVPAADCSVHGRS